MKQHGATPTVWEYPSRDLVDEIHPHERREPFLSPGYGRAPGRVSAAHVPPRVGHEITTLMGIRVPCLQREKPQDYDWIVPPAE